MVQLQCKDGEKQWKMVIYVSMTSDKTVVYLPFLMDTEVKMFPSSQKLIIPKFLKKLKSHK